MSTRVDEALPGSAPESLASSPRLMHRLRLVAVSVVGAAGAVVSMVTDSAPEVALMLPAISVDWAVIEWEPSVRTLDLMVQVPAASWVSCPKAGSTLTSLRCRTAPAGACSPLGPRPIRPM